nr:probable plastid-lipid-associated protein 4, chloroplastic isoform X2 [Ziziphus jujuba var. spinosa]
MALSPSYSPAFLSTSHSSSSSLKLVQFHNPLIHSYFPEKPTSASPIHTLPTSTSTSASNQKWRARVSFFPAFLNRAKVAESLKEQLLEAITPLDRGAEATPEDQQRVDQIARKLEAVNQIKEPLKSDLLNGKWELIYTTSTSILQTQITANLVPLNSRRVAVKFDFFKIASLIPIKSPGSGRGQLEITYLDEELRISRGNRGNLFVLKMVDPSYRIPN